MKEVFEFFDGGREGVRQRFAFAIKAGLEETKRVSVFDARLLERHARLEDGTVKRIEDGDSSVITWPVIESLAAPLNITLEDGFGRFVNFTEEDEAEWLRLANERRFVGTAGADGMPCTPSQRVKAFIYLQAIKNL